MRASTIFCDGAMGLPVCAKHLRRTIAVAKRLGDREGVMFLKTLQPCTHKTHRYCACCDGSCNGSDGCGCYGCDPRYDEIAARPKPAARKRSWYYSPAVAR